MITRMYRSVVVTALLTLPGTALLAERAPELLSNPAQVQTFHRATARLNSFCGCHGRVGDCLHIDDGCFAVQARRFVERRILEGMGEDEIVRGFVSGFGDRIRADPQIQSLESQGERGLVMGFVRGFGTRILHRGESRVFTYAVIIGAVALFLILARRLLRHTAASGPQRDPGRVTESHTRVRKILDEWER